jgi:hypothetical protein
MNRITLALSFLNDHNMTINLLRLFIVILYFTALSAKAQPEFVIRATPTEHNLTIDGILDEEEWENAEVISQFVQREPAEGSPATRVTEIRILFGADNVYIGAVMHDTPDDIENTLGRRDEFNRADWLLVSFDSYFNRRTAYTFAINAAGVQLDGIQGRIPTTGTTVNSRIEGLDTSWDAIWFSAVRITDQGWNAEIRIPYSMLRFPGVEEQTWGLHITRRIPRLGEVTEWPYIPRTERANLVARYGQIQGIRNLEPRRNLQIRPYVLAGLDMFESADNPGKGDHKTRFDVGGDIKVGLGPNIMLDATVNPDFGQVEADPAVLNLTAFETLYTEKRPFFVEGADIFQFGIGRSSLFYTRRIGARDPIIGAAKVSGRSARGLSFRLLGTSSGHDFKLAHNYGVARASQQIGSYSSAGGIVTVYQSPAETGSGWKSMTGGVDWDMRFGENRYSFEGIAAFANREPLSPDKEAQRGFMGGLIMKKREGIIDGHVTLLVFSDRYNPNDIGWTSFEQNFYEAWSGLTYNIRAGQPFGPFQRANIRLYHRQRYSYIQWWNMGDFFSIRSEWMTLNSQMIRFSSSFSEVIGGYDIWETRGLDRWARPSTIMFTGEYNTDDRRNWMVTSEGSFKFAEDGGKLYMLGVKGNLDVGTRLSFTGSVKSEWERANTAWASNETFRKTDGWWFIGNRSDAPDKLSHADFTRFNDWGLLSILLSDYPEYSPGYYYVPVFGKRNSGFLDFTLRGAVTFTNTLSLQLYTQLFLARGKYDDFSLLINPDHLASYWYPKQHDFAYQNLHSNLVMRWEYRPGSTIFLVWSHGRNARDEANPLAPPVHSPYIRPFGNQIGDVFGIFPNNSFMMKASYAIF